MIELGINIDHVATLRQSRLTPYPEPVHAALEAERYGADGITAHLREDRRHIQDRDMRLLRETVQTKLNLEMALTEEMVTVAEEVRPHDCCLVPERRAELTTEGGLDVASQVTTAQWAVERLAGAGVRVSLFVDPEPEQLEAAARAGAPVVELHTGTFANAEDAVSRSRELERLEEGVAKARALGLRVHAGHGLDYLNVRAVAGLPGVRELNIGHAIVARAILAGMGPAVAEMKALIHQAALGQSG
ncbi:pyridoxine 5'-phosphate synthase [Thiohalorhabdus sp.]|uniref:pyridoxine 5'-phosphate synthase n=1 Tax=Thiohalorhabdus sp. TaxID=3094134 RepID=UPI002FC2DF33